MTRPTLRIAALLLSASSGACGAQDAGEAERQLRFIDHECVQVLIDRNIDDAPANSFCGCLAPISEGLSESDVIAMIDAEQGASSIQLSEELEGALRQCRAPLLD